MDEPLARVMVELTRQACQQVPDAWLWRVLPWEGDACLQVYRPREPETPGAQGTIHLSSKLGTASDGPLAEAVRAEVAALVKDTMEVDCD